MESTRSELYFVFMNFDPDYERLLSDREGKSSDCWIGVLMPIQRYEVSLTITKTKRGAYELDMYLSRKHDELLATTFEPGSYKKTLSLLIVDGFAVEITDHQANVLRSAKGVRIVEKNQELA